MQHVPEHEIRRRRDGSIDTAHYAQIGRGLHGKVIRDAARSLIRLIGKNLKPLGGRRNNPSNTSPPEPTFSAAE